MKKLIFGCGYLGQRVAQRWLSQGDEVFAVTRSPERAALLQQQGLQAIVADLTKRDTLQNLPAVNTVLFAVGYDRTNKTNQSIHDVYVAGLQNVLDSLKDGVQRLIYISSTGVYGQVAGDWVDEDSSCQPNREGGRACLAAEQLLGHHPLHDRTFVLRLAGIYGPGRIPMRHVLSAGHPLPVPSEGTLNLIYVEDAADIVCLVEKKGMPPSLYVVSDGHPVIRAEYYRHLAELIAAPPPRFERPSPESLAAARAASDKRVNNVKLLAELAPQFNFPTYREGLAAIVRQEG